MSQSATPATRNEAMQHLKHPKITPFATFRIGTATFCHDSRPRSRSHMSQSATLATRNGATQHLEHPKITLFATFLIGTATFCHDGHHMSQNATPATEFALGRHFAQPCQCNSVQTRNKNDILCKFSHRHRNFLPPRSRVGHRSTCHKMPRLPCETKLRHT